MTAVAEAGREVRRVREAALHAAVLEAYEFSAKQDWLPVARPEPGGGASDRARRGGDGAGGSAWFVEAKRLVTRNCIQV
jgi:hypothetical protein